MPTLQELLAQQASLNQQITSLRSESRQKAIAQARELMAAHGITVADLAAPPAAPQRGPRPNAGVKVAAKYRDPDNGATWTGRGLKPRWLTAHLEAGKSLMDFAIRA